MWLDALKQMKSQSGLTTSEIAKGSGIPEPTLEKLFAGVTKDPKLPTMQKLVHFLGFTLDDLYGEKQKLPVPIHEIRKLNTNEVISTFVKAGLIEEGQDLSDSDLRFLISIADAIESWFANRNNIL